MIFYTLHEKHYSKEFLFTMICFKFQLLHLLLTGEDNFLLLVMKEFGKGSYLSLAKITETPINCESSSAVAEPFFLTWNVKKAEIEQSSPR